MKTRCRSYRNGSVLVVVLCITGIFTLVAAYYFSAVNQQHKSVVRSQTWNASMPMADAGVEDALTHLNKNCKYLQPGDVFPPDGRWNAIGTGIYEKTQVLGDSRYRAVIDMTTINAAGNYEPIIYSEGYTPKPLVQRSSGLAFASITDQYLAIDQIEGSPTTNFVPRAVWVRTRKSPLFEGPLNTKDSITINGGGKLVIDSFDSTDPNRSNNGGYKPGVGDQGDIATNGDIVNVGNSTIKGKVRTGPGGTIKINANGSVGDLKWHEDGNTGIQPGWGSDDFYQDFPDATLPDDPEFNANTSPTSGKASYTTTNFAEVLTTCLTGPTCVPAGTNGVVTPLTTNVISASYPAFGTYVGGVVTNWGTVTNSSHPGDGYADVKAVTQYTTSETMPTSGTYLGEVVTTQVAKEGSSEPAAGSYVPGTLKKQGQKYKWSVYAYAFDKIVGYSYKTPLYTFGKIIGQQRVALSPTITTNTGTYTQIFTAGDAVVSGLPGTTLIKGPGTTRLHVTGDLTSSGITIAPGASLEIYMAGKSTDVKGNGLINATGSATNFQYYGLPTNEEVSFGGNAQFVGTIYAPSANFKQGGGGNNSLDFIGAAIVKNAFVNGHFSMHYDEALERFGPNKGYRIVQWREVAVNKSADADAKE